nr:feline leukemia virus subgroup C receptor-related protein 2-like [Leptinotarsa decemlineata]
MSSAHTKNSFPSLSLLFLVFKDAPPTPPSHAVAQQDSTEFVISLKNLLKDKSFMLLFSAYGISTGVFYAISTLLNQIILHYYPNGNEDAGRIGLVIIVAGMIGSVCCGVILDRYHKFKETILTVYALALMGMVLFTFTVSTGLYVVYITSFLLGFFMTGLLPIGFELAAELTYPEPEGTSSGLLNLSASVCGIIFTNLYSVIFYQVDAMWANISMCLMLFVGTVLLACTSSNLKRQAAQTKKNGVP